MNKLSLLLVLYACVGHGRRVQSSEAMTADDELAKLKKKMGDKKFKNIQDLEQQIDADMQTLIADPSLKEFEDASDKIIAEKMKDIFAEPEFSEIHEHSKKIDILIEELNEKVNVVNKQMESIATNEMTVEEQMKAMEEKPEFQAFQAQRKDIDEKIKVMRSLPLFEKFQEHAKTVIDGEIEALKADPKYKSTQDKAKHIEEQMEKLTNDPNFKEYQELVMKLAEQTGDEGAESQSLAQISESHAKVDAKQALKPVRRLSNLLPTVNTTAAFDAAYSRSAMSDLRTIQQAWMKLKRMGSSQ